MSYNHVTIKIVRKYETAQYCKRCIRVSKSILYIENTFFFIFLHVPLYVCRPIIILSSDGSGQTFIHEILFLHALRITLVKNNPTLKTNRQINRFNLESEIIHVYYCI